MADKSLKNKVVVITGGANGLGFEISNNFLLNGAKVVIIVDHNKDQGDEAVKKFNAAYGTGKAIFYKGNITSEDDLNNIFNSIVDTYKNVDVLVNNAGVGNEIDYKLCIDVNVTYLIGWSIKYWEHMRKDKGGKGGTIINISSIYGYRIDPYIPVYQASKFAVFGFTKSLGLRYNFENYGVRVVAICPGMTHTNMTKSENMRIWEDPKRIEDFSKYLETLDWQNPDAVGKAAVDVFERAESGTAWLIEGGRPIEEVP